MDKVIEEGALRLLITESSCDVILSCSDRRLIAHKLVLSIASPVFRELLQKHTGDSTTVLILPDVSGQTMSIILDYIYTGTVVIYGHALDDFLSVAKFLRIALDEGNIENILKNLATVKKDEKTKKQLPDLLPIVEKKKICKVIVPSPWCQRRSSFLSDPRIMFDQMGHVIEDKNNNFPKQSNQKCLDQIVRELKEKIVDPDRPLKSEQAGSNQPELVKRDVNYFNQNTTSGADSSNDDLKNDYGRTIKRTKRKAFECTECGKTFSQLRNYKYHRSIHEGTKEFSAECSECGKTFNDRGYLSSHMKIHRDRKEYACPHCPKRFNQRVAYNMHLRIHTGLKPHGCPTCGKSFSRKMLLKQHQRVHTGERPYSCPECGKTFADRSNMSLHAKLHTGVKPYACTVCPKTFTKKHHLKTHMNFHTGLKPYKCENCELAFSQSSNMRTHYKKCILKDQMGSTSTGNIEENSA
ncbi:hypothetical protein ABEB36_012264 [Hypothenemus hampei]|uniref:Uncharacterized protein n=1 Tax=Hypothenemus hampei TaxID=57062 RepID=A0ABD1EAL4_HYPHA